MKRRPLKKSDVAKLRRTVVVDKTIYGITGNLLYNMTVRDVRAIRRSFEKVYGARLKETDELFSDAAALVFVAGQKDTGIREEYQKTLTGLSFKALETFGSAVLLLRNGHGDQALVLVRQVIEICSVIIHIVTDPNDTALEKFELGSYASTKSIGSAKKAIPIIGYFWGYLSETFVHITKHHSIVRGPKPYEAGDEEVESILTCLRMTVWVLYLTSELAFPRSADRNRYWKHGTVAGRPAVGFDPDPEERAWFTRFLDIDEVREDDLTADIAPVIDEGPEHTKAPMSTGSDS